MTFLNWIMLTGLAGVGIPILIHLLSRSRSRIVDWGAMRFLELSLASRSRRILLEEILLMILRCLVIALAAFALARPFLPSRPTLLILLFLPAVLGAAICAALAAVMWSARRARWLLLAATAGLLLLPVGAAALEQTVQSDRWSFGRGQKDVAIVIDGSTSMMLETDGNTNFDRAIDEARAVAAHCGPGDGISLVLAGRVPQAVIGSPMANRKDVATALSALRPVGGSMAVVPALRRASETLAEGGNPARKIVLITDGRNVGWDVRAEARWKLLASELARHPTTPEIIVRTLDSPERFANAAVSEMAPDRRIVGTDREVQVHVKVENRGTEVLRERTVKLLIDGKEVESAQVDELPPRAVETVRFEHRFEAAGRHIVTAKLAESDDLAGDDTADRVVDVLDALRVLIVDGAPSTRALEGAGEFAEIALAPPHADDGPKRSRPGKYGTSLVAAKVVPAVDVATVDDLSGFAVVVLADVARLPAAFAGKLADFVEAGGGLLVAPGGRAAADFYDAWVDETGRPVMPAKLGRFRSAGDEPAGLSPKTFNHPALAALAAEGRSDVRSARVSSYWQIQPPTGDRDVAVGGEMDTGEALLVERRLGKGYVLLTATALHPNSTNLPALNCFVPLVHELTYYLAGPSRPACNVPCGGPISLELTGPLPVGGLMEVLSPAGRRLAATATQRGQTLNVSFDQTQQPGLYRLILPPQLAKPNRAMSPNGRGAPFVAIDDGDEGLLTKLTEADLQTARRHVREALGEQASGAKVLVRVESAGELAAAVGGGIPGRELWQWIAVVLVGALLAEVALTRWIAQQRRVHTTAPVAFGAQGVDIRSFRERARQMVAVDERKLETSETK